VFVPVYEGGESDGEVGRNGFSGGRGKASGTAGGGGGEARAGASQFLRSGGRFQNFEMTAIGRARVLVGEAEFFTIYPFFFASFSQIDT